MEIFGLFAILLVLIVFLLLVFALLFNVFEELWIYIFKKPLFIHWYLRNKKITPEQEFILRHRFQFYQKLSDKHKRYFHHRLASFIHEYQFIPRNDFAITQEVETLIGATYVMLTFGMRHYLIDSFDKIIIYPEAYYSVLEQHHKGEFNPRLKAIVFSWQDFVEGYEISNDNLNLGIHEFTHAIQFHSLRKNDVSSLIFRRHYEQLIREVAFPTNRQKLVDSCYFRIYAYTNPYEFVAVIGEHYFETPELFQKEFPQLYENVRRMLNHKGR
jgi:Mlc titration factor MtfA (ptsG expression regulator)